MSTDVVLVLTTAPAGDEIEAMARAIVDERLAACVSLLPPMTSIYRWDGGVERSTEAQLIIKTTRARVEALRTRLAQSHPYALPEFVVIAVTDGSPAYLEWVRASTHNPDAAG